MPWLDLGLAAILIAFAAHGLKQGLIRQAANLLGLILGLILAIVSFDPLSERLFPTEGLFGPLLFVAILLGIWGTLNLLGIMAWRKLRVRQDRWIDDWGGALLGLVIGILALATILAGFSTLDSSFARQLVSSPLSAHLVELFWATWRLIGSRSGWP